jgi:hypothetical protein
MRGRTTGAFCASAGGVHARRAGHVSCGRQSLYESTVTFLYQESTRKVPNRYAPGVIVCTATHCFHALNAICATFEGHMEH